ncbi:MAG: RsmD family RNA methyltransferase [Bacteroidales bacterium]|jgi:16S rRNA (guanine(966)-N(2))-methyltransferase RsmD|nr:RsmD family RNA methyltransferase [Bacteroidales bacterium]
MRIVSGIYRGRRLQPPANLPVRPTTDFAKEGLFNVLSNIVDFESLSILDLFTGTGSISFEFLSRGAKEVTAVDANHRCIDFLKKSAAEFGITNLQAVKSNAFVFLKHMVAKYDLIFADPPYDLVGITEIPDFVLDSGLLDNDGLFIMEHSARYQFEKHPSFFQTRAYGSVNFSFFKKS